MQITDLWISQSVKKIHFEVIEEYRRRKDDSYTYNTADYVWLQFLFSNNEYENIIVHNFL